MRREARSNRACGGAISRCEGHTEAEGSHGHNRRQAIEGNARCPWLPLAHGAPTRKLRKLFLPPFGAERPTSLLLVVTANRLCQ